MNSDIPDFLLYLQQIANEIQSDTLRDQIALYRAGSSNRIPSCWKRDYAEYLTQKKLKEKSNDIN